MFLLFWYETQMSFLGLTRIRSKRFMIPSKKIQRCSRAFLMCVVLGKYLLACSVEKQPPVPFEGQSPTQDLDSAGLNAKAHREEGQMGDSKVSQNPSDDLDQGGGQPQNTLPEVPSPGGPKPTPSPGAPMPQPPKDPGGTPTQQEDPILQLHQNKPPECAGCHEKKRLSATHYPKSDCVLCHKYPSFKGGFFAHDPKPETCESCHARPQTTGLRSYPNQGPPANFDPNDPASIGGGHYRGKDCAQCHQTKKEGATAFLFSHSTPNPGVCLPCHYNQGLRQHRNSQNVTLTGSGNCNSCHIHFDAKVLRDFRPGN